jgi:hypothetical protein
MKYIVNVRGKLKGDPSEIQAIHDDIVSRLSPVSRPMGATGHQTFLNVQDDREFFSIDSWDNLEAIQKLYSDPNLATEFAKMFEGQPQVTIWAETGWYEF